MWGLIPRRKPQVIVHVGLPKCGSTAIQAHFADHDAANRARGVVYPVAGRAPDGYRSHRPLSHASAADLPRLLADIAAEAKGAHTVFLSCESWSTQVPNGRAHRFAKALKQVFDPRQITVVAWFRDPVSFLESGYAQFLVGGLLNVMKPAFFAPEAGAPNIDRFVTAATQANGFAPYDYLTWIAAIEAAFSGMRVEARSMASGDLVTGGLIADVRKCVGLRPASGDAPLRNARPDAPSLLALQYAQTHIPPDVMTQKRAAMRALHLPTAAEWEDSDQRHADLHVGPALYQQIAALLARDSEALKRRFDTPVAGLLTIAKPGPLSTRALSAGEQAHALAHVGQARTRPS